MFKSFFGLSKDPFSLNPDPLFLYANDGTRQALAGLVHGILNRRGFVVLTGESGTGKSTLLRAALSRIPKETLASSLIFNPLLSPDDFIEYAMTDFGIENVAANKSKRILQLQEFLLDNHKAGQISLLMVDEAHLLAPALLEEIRLLTNHETSDCKLLQVVLAGHTDLDQTLDRADLRQLKQRIGVRVSLAPLSPSEVGRYMLSRWNKAGGSDLPFEPGAIQEIATASRGVPRLVNSICDNALIAAYGDDQRQITRDTILEVRRSLRLDSTTNGNASSANQDGDLDLMLPSLQPRVQLGGLEFEPEFIERPKTGRSILGLES